MLRNSLQSGVPINGIHNDETAFSNALKQGRYSIATFLLNLGADPDLGFSNSEPSALALAAQSGENKLAKTLIIKGADINHVDQTGYSPLSYATVNRHMTTMKVLINAGADVNMSPDGYSILMHAVKDNNAILVKLLLEAGADVNYEADNGDTALKLARRAEYFDLDLMLVQSGARW